MARIKFLNTFPLSLSLVAFTGRPMALAVENRFPHWLYSPLPTRVSQGSGRSNVNDATSQCRINGGKT